MNPRQGIETVAEAESLFAIGDGRKTVNPRQGIETPLSNSVRPRTAPQVGRQ